MKQYTVIVDRPTCVLEGDANDRQFVLVEAETPEEAMKTAQTDCLRIDSKEGTGDTVSMAFAWLQPHHYPMVAVFEGWHMPVLEGEPV